MIDKVLQRPSSPPTFYLNAEWSFQFGKLDSTLVQGLPLPLEDILGLEGQQSKQTTLVPYLARLSAENFLRVLMLRDCWNFLSSSLVLAKAHPEWAQQRDNKPYLSMGNHGLFFLGLVVIINNIMPWWNAECRGPLYQTFSVRQHCNFEHCVTQFSRRQTHPAARTKQTLGISTVSMSHFNLSTKQIFDWEI